ncbi:MAG TPA: N-acetyltransferase [Magnetovibrio sp.]
MTRIRDAYEDDLQAIYDVVEAAFGGLEECQLIERLYGDGLVQASMVAVEDGEIVGHILFSALEITDSEHKQSLKAVALAPVAVAPTHQGLGIGSELIRQGIEKCKELDLDAIVVLGHAAYYPRFGFSSEIAECLKSPFSGPNFMVLPLVQGIFNDFFGIVTYPDAFGLPTQQ